MIVITSRAIIFLTCITLIGCSSIVRIATISDLDLLPFATPPAIGGNARVERLGDNLFRVRLANVEAIRVNQPENSQLCWAACAAMVLRSQGATTVDQAALSRYFSDGKMDVTIDVPTLARLLVPELEAEYSWKLKSTSVGLVLEHVFQVHKVSSQAHSDFLIEELSRGYPVIVGFRDKDAHIGHACVIVGATYAMARPPRKGDYFHLTVLTFSNPRSRDARFFSDASASTYRKYALESIEFLDPDPTTSPNQVLAASELKEQVDFLLTSNLARSLIREFIRSAEREAQRRKKKTTRYRYRRSIGTR